MEKKIARRCSRELALKSIFNFLVREKKSAEIFAENLTVAEKKSDEFAEKIFAAATKNLAKIKIVIRAFAPDFLFEKIATINRAILILGIAEIKFLDTPPAVVINECVELAKIFGEKKSSGFINGVLDKFQKSFKK